MIKIHPARSSLKIRLGGNRPDLESLIPILLKLAEFAGDHGAPVRHLAAQMQALVDGNHRMFIAAGQPNGCWFEMDLLASDLERAIPVIREHMFSGLRKGMQSIQALTFTIHAARALEAAKTPVPARMMARSLAL